MSTCLSHLGIERGRMISGADAGGGANLADQLQEMFGPPRARQLTIRSLRGLVREARILRLRLEVLISRGYHGRVIYLYHRALRRERRRIGKLNEAMR